MVSYYLARLCMYHHYNINLHDNRPSFSLYPSAERGGSWVVDRVVGPADLVAPDDSLREQMRRLQLSPPTAGPLPNKNIDLYMYTISHTLCSRQTFIHCQITVKYPQGFFCVNGMCSVCVCVCVCLFVYV